MVLTADEVRLREAREGVPWRQWGPYLSERQWGTVREDYSTDGDAWSYFTHDQARSRAYRWGEDGLAGVSDDKGRLCLSLALWNGADPILKERLFGLTNSEGNHGEDVKEYYFYADNTPTHSWMRWRYKYPQQAFPYEDLVADQRGARHADSEYELIDTGIFDDDRYFDVEVDYAKASPDRPVCAGSPSRNRGDADASRSTCCPTLWFRNTWSWGATATPSPPSRAAATAVHARHATLGDYYLHAPDDAELIFTENETDNERLFGSPNAAPYVKDGFDRCRRPRASGRGQRRTARAPRSAVHWHGIVPAHGEVTVVVRLPGSHRRRGRARRSPTSTRCCDRAPRATPTSSTTVDHAVVDGCRHEAAVMRQALAGMLWTKQHYYFDLDLWLREHQGHPLRPPVRGGVRNAAWFHMLNDDIISMPDTWEYPWYAAWDLAFHTSRSRWSTLTSPRASSTSCCRRPTCTRPGRSRPTSGTSAT